MKKNATLLLFALFQTVMAFSQLPVTGNFQKDILAELKNYRDQKSRVTVHIDPLIEDNYYKHIIYNQKDPGVLGYRIRIFRDSGTDARERATEVRSKFILKFEGEEADLKYVDNTDWVIYVGNCRTRSEALKLYNKVKVDFPYSFIVSQRINVSDE
jgi:hypothetical protein